MLQNLKRVIKNKRRQKINFIKIIAIIPNSNKIYIYIYIYINQFKKIDI